MLLLGSNLRLCFPSCSRFDYVMELINLPPKRLGLWLSHHLPHLKTTLSPRVDAFLSISVIECNFVTTFPFLCINQVLTSFRKINMASNTKSNFIMASTAKIISFYSLFRSLKVRSIPLGQSKHSKCPTGVKHHHFRIIIFFPILTKLSCKIPSS